jgi:hypothetical protein
VAYLSIGDGTIDTSRKNPARLDPVIYKAWLEESPKKIQGGPLELTTCIGYSDADDAVNLENHKIISNILDSPRADSLHIIGFHIKYEGFKIYVNIENKFLLMGHQYHSGPFKSEDGRDFEDHPHFHQIKYHRDRRGMRIPRKTYEVPISLSAGMNSAELLEAFLMHYFFDDGRINPVQMPSSKKQYQSELGKFEKEGWNK